MTEATIPEDDLQRVQQLVENRRQPNQRGGGIWNSLDEVPDDVVDAVVSGIQRAIGASHGSTRCMPARSLERYVNAEADIDRLQSGSIGRVCSLLTETDTGHPVTVEVETPSSNDSGTVWRFIDSGASS